MCTTSLSSYHRIMNSSFRKFRSLFYFIEMCASVMVIHHDIKFKDTLTTEQVEIYAESSFTITEDRVIIPQYVWFKEEFFTADLDELYAFCTDEKVKVKGNIFIVRKQSDDDEFEPTQQHIKIGVKGYEIEDCSFNVTLRHSNNGEKKKALTEEEKIALFKEYWEKKRKIPPPKEVYKDFRIGTFYNTCKKNGDLLNVMNTIQHEC